MVTTTTLKQLLMIYIQYFPLNNVNTTTHVSFKAQLLKALNLLSFTKLY